MVAAQQLEPWNLVSAAVPLNIPLEAADRLVAGSPDAWLADAADAYQAERDTMLVSVGLPGLLAPVRKRVHVKVGPISRADHCVRRQLAWEAASQARLFPVMEGNLTVTRTGPRYSILEVRAHYQPPLGPAGRLADRALLHLVAAASIRRFASELATRLEGLAEEA